MSIESMETGWMDKAACGRAADPNIFFEEHKKAEALSICASCIVRAECSEFGKKFSFGIYGGNEPEKWDFDKVCYEGDGLLAEYSEETGQLIVGFIGGRYEQGSPKGVYALARHEAEVLMLKAAGLEQSKIDEVLTEPEIYGAQRRSKTSASRTLALMRKKYACRTTSQVVDEAFDRGQLVVTLQAEAEMTGDDIKLIQLTRDGLSDKEIANQTGASSHSVRHRRWNLYKKFGIKRHARTAQTVLITAGYLTGVLEPTQ